jgi:hypothetical protein
MAGRNSWRAIDLPIGAFLEGLGLTDGWQSEGPGTTWTQMTFSHRVDSRTELLTGAITDRERQARHVGSQAVQS